jgi:anhydro-N-acetylmuramic acid kinase
MAETLLFIGVMSGSSLDGIDVVLTKQTDSACKILATHFQPYSAKIKSALLTLHFPLENELEASALMANQLARLYALAINTLLNKHNIKPSQVSAIGCHGQTIRHCPQYKDSIGYTIQLGNNALLAELTNISVVGDFRSRDIAAGGQGAPLVPAFHQAMFASKTKNRAIINIGGIANITFLTATGEVSGFDSGPGNILLDHWVRQKLKQDYDTDGAWAATGNVNQSMLKSMLAEPYFKLLPPKSTGRDLFNETWLKQHTPLACRPQDIARTLVELTTISIHQAITQHYAEVNEVYLCGGGAHNKLLLDCLKQQLGSIILSTTDQLGVDADWVEATAFAWLAKQTIQKTPSNLPSATGADGLRILGAIHYA